MQDYGETSHVPKRKEKIGVKLGSGKRRNTKIFFNLTFTLFFALKLL